MTTETIDLPLGADADCTPCAGRLRDVVSHHAGVEAVRGMRDDTVLRVTLDAERCDAACLGAAVDEAREDLHRRFAHRELAVAGMDCADCATRIEQTVARLPGVDGVTVSVTAARMRLELDTRVGDLDDVRRRVSRLGYGIADVAPGATTAPLPASAAGDACCGGHDAACTSSPPSAGRAPVVAVGPLRTAAAEWLRGSDRVTGIAAALLALAVLLDVLPVHGAWADGAYGLATLAGGVAIARSGIRGALATRRPDMNLLMAIAVVGAVAIGAWLEAALVVVLFSVGELLEGRAVGRARRELEALVELAPQVAVVRRTHVHGDGTPHEQDVEVPVAELRIGDLLVVAPGGQLPADGTIVQGASAIDQAAITGESTPVDRVAGDAVFAGTLNGEGLLLVETTSAPGDTTLDRIARLVADAQARRSPSERWVQAFARVYTPIVIVAALVVTTIPPALGLLALGDAFYSALALLILACPCALVLSTPVSIVSALGRASAAGVLVKGGAHLERAATIRTVAFDKTGTLTAGTPRVVQIDAIAPDGTPHPAGATPQATADAVLALAAALERGSRHPLAVAIVAAADDAGLVVPAASDLRSLTGLGAAGTVDGAPVRVGSPRLFADAGPSSADVLARRLQEAGRTVVLVERDGVVVGALGLADRPRPEAREATALLARVGVERTAMLTGDTARTAAAVAADLGITDVHADLMPGDKSDAVRRLGDGVAMVGDGVNDTPALAAADLGIAMGGAGSPAAVEVADVALMGDDPRKVAELIGLARWTRSVVRQNIAFSLGTKAVAAIFLLFGALPLWAAVGVDVGASLLVVANGLRLVRGRPIGGSSLPLLERRPATAAAPA